MSLLQHLQTMAAYNKWANCRLYDACQELPEADYHAERPVFFKSIHGTLNHILVGDLMWAARINGDQPDLKRLDTILHPDLPSLRRTREEQDQCLVELVDRTTDADLERDYSYNTLTFGPMRNQLKHMLAHLFNHQTHHRGQVHDQLSQTAVPPPPLDLMFYLRELG